MPLCKKDLFFISLFTYKLSVVLKTQSNFITLQLFCNQTSIIFFFFFNPFAHQQRKLLGSYEQRQLLKTKVFVRCALLAHVVTHASGNDTETPFAVTST